LVTDPYDKEPIAPSSEDEPGQGVLSMADLLKEEETSGFKSLKRGEITEGSIMQVDRESIMVDVGSKTEGVVPSHEMRSLTAEDLAEMHVGDPILVYVLQTENQEGQIVLSVDRATGERGWRSLQQRFEAQEIFEAEVVGYNKGGLLVNIEGVRGFVPTSQALGLRGDAAEEGAEGVSDDRFGEWIGKTQRPNIIEINRRRNRLILSERAAHQEWRAQQKERLLSELQEGSIRTGTVTSIRPFGVFVDLGGADGLIHLSELSWGRNTEPEEVVKVGDDIDVFILKVDPETKKIALSLRRARPEAWEQVIEKYDVGQRIRGTITKLTNFGAFAHIEGPVEGLIHISELADRRITHPKEVVKEGDVLTLKIVRVERDRHRVGLSLRQAVDELEAEDRGSVRRTIEALRDESLDRAPTLGDAYREQLRQGESRDRSRYDAEDDEA